MTHVIRPATVDDVAHLVYHRQQMNASGSMTL
jgi:hypothetical protein